ncbi:hypothetical protein [Paenibacillus sp. J22TS3]|nr:hypothetical protein [Paenibacillus sp. J22TS3]GIP21058.1 hypothetical protein J22TS3_13330 [Paenibacillus sp. J22TS3]
MANGIIVTAIEPIEFHRRRVMMIDAAASLEYEILYGCSVSERVIP